MEGGSDGVREGVMEGLNDNRPLVIVLVCQLKLGLLQNTVELNLPPFSCSFDARERQIGRSCGVLLKEETQVLKEHSPLPVCPRLSLVGD